MENHNVALRNSDMELGEVYFWTATIHHWIKILEPDDYKSIILDSLKELSNRGKIDIYAFVIMPNHIHLIWKLNEKNGKEWPNASFLKFTAHEFKKRLKLGNDDALRRFHVNASNKSYEFWQRDPLAIRLYTREVALQKLNYIHHNPLAEHWQLAKDPSDYYYSSASFYERNETIFPFLKWIWDAI